MIPRQVMDNPSRKRTATDEGESERGKRICLEKAQPLTASLAEDTYVAERTPSPSIGSKRTISEVEDQEEETPRLAFDSRALYEANKTEIDAWYDEQYSMKLGIPKYNKVKHSTDRWFTKVDAWMTHKGLTQPTRKKQRLSSTTSVSEEVQDGHETRPDRVKYPGDSQSVPEHPLDKLSDFTPMPNGRYPCGHISQSTAKCCTEGLTKQIKQLAIRKSITTWRSRVERLIDERQLSIKHKTWDNWTLPHLRQKYQPEVFQAQKDRKELRQRQMQMKASVDTAGNVSEHISSHVPVLPAPSLHHRRPFQPAQQGNSVREESSNPIVQYQSRPSDSEGVQAWRLERHAPGAGTEYPQPLPSHHGINVKDPQRTAQRTYPSYPYMANVTPREQYVPLEEQTSNKRFEEARSTPKAVGQVQSGPSVPFEIRSRERADSESERPLATHPILPAKPAILPARPDVLPARPDILPEKPILPAKPAILPAEPILPAKPILPAEPATPTVDSTLPRPRSVQTEDLYLTSLPQAFATGDSVVDSKIHDLLNLSYQIGTPTWQTSPEDEKLLQHTIDETRADWQRYVAFFGNGGHTDEQTQAVGLPSLSDELGFGGLEFGEMLTEEQPTAPYPDGSVGRSLLAQYYAEVAAMHADILDKLQ
ncbi:hypothetical protein OPT61_g6698 [Boeremia exigua]|uniref:Uncharacterized protein n=1 Tax=Boeremia exigua TaxID=749465 RepID=A0ACC2I616_9PLEO|nr:hypothetical protein OPT61_g6698 [Boeremia exigua]